MSADVLTEAANRMILQIEKKNDPIIQRIKQTDPALYEALRKPDRITFTTYEDHVFGCSGDVEIGVDIFPPMILSKNVKLDLIQITFRDPPTGADFISDIRKRSHGNSILKASIVFPAGFTETIERAEFGIDTFNKGDVLISDVLQVGSATPGSMLTMYLRFIVL